MKNILTPLAKSVLIPLGLMAAASAADAFIQKKIHELGIITLIISNKENNDIMEIGKALEESGLLMKGAIKTIENEAKDQKVGFLSMILGRLVASLLGNLLARKEVI